jgi:hypothetical protein
MATIIRFARTAGIDVSFYLDDTLLRATAYDIAQRDLRVLGQLFQLAGFLLHKAKSVSEPTQVIKYLGFLIDSRNMSISLPTEKSQKIRESIAQALPDTDSRTPWTIRKAAQLIGWLLAALPAVRYGGGHFRSLENAKKWALMGAANDYDAEQVIWSNKQQQDLRWWYNLPLPWSRCFRSIPFTDEFTSKRQFSFSGLNSTLLFIINPLSPSLLQRTPLWRAGESFIMTNSSTARGTNKNRSSTSSNY